MPDYSELCKGKMKEDLSDFLTNTKGNVDVPTVGEAEGLLGLLRKPPSMQRDLQPLTRDQIAGFKLCPGKLETLNDTLASSHRKKKKRRDAVEGDVAESRKHKKKRKKKREDAEIT